MTGVRNDLRTTHIDPLYGHPEPDPLVGLSADAAERLKTWADTQVLHHPPPSRWEPAVKPTPPARKPARRKKDTG